MHSHTQLLLCSICFSIQWLLSQTVTKSCVSDLVHSLPKTPPWLITLNTFFLLFCNHIQKSLLDSFDPSICRHVLGACFSCLFFSSISCTCRLPLQKRFYAGNYIVYAFIFESMVASSFWDVFERVQFYSAFVSSFASKIFEAVLLAFSTQKKRFSELFWALPRASHSRCLLFLLFVPFFLKMNWCSVFLYSHAIFNVFFSSKRSCLTCDERTSSPH